MKYAHGFVMVVLWFYYMVFGSFTWISNPYISRLLHSHWCVLHCPSAKFSNKNGRHFPDDIFQYIFLNENEWISIKISLKFVPKGPINNIPASDQIMAWRRLGDKPLSEPMVVRLPTHMRHSRGMS